VATVESSPVTADDIRAARPGVATTARRTPVLSTRTFSERAGGIVALKAENLQRTGSFKVRGAGAKLTALGEEGCAAGVVGASAGNHAQALAAAARTLGVRCEVFVPADAPIAKTEAARGQGAIVHIGGAGVLDCVELAQQRAREGGLAFVHPFDDPDVVAGQGTLGLELLEEVPDLARVVIPVGGGGLCSGVAIAVKSARPEVEVIGVQVADTSLTIADGIAVKAPGELTRRLLDQWVDDMAIVGEDETAEAMVLLMERCKLVVEGAGAVGVAALLGGQVAPAARGTTVAVLSGGNVDPGLLASIARRHETEVGRRLVLLTRVADRPGALAGLLACVADTGANIVHVSHHREGLDLHVRETAVELVLETRGHEHAQRVMETLSASGYEAGTLT
jgi:threonine dehydratase